MLHFQSHKIIIHRTVNFDEFFFKWYLSNYCSHYVIHLLNIFWKIQDTVILLYSKVETNVLQRSKTKKLKKMEIGFNKNVPIQYTTHYWLVQLYQSYEILQCIKKFFNNYSNFKCDSCAYLWCKINDKIKQIDSKI